MSKSDSNSNKAALFGFNHQDDINMGLNCEDDIDAAPEEEAKESVLTVVPSENIQVPMLLRK